MSQQQGNFKWGNKLIMVAQKFVVAVMFQSVPLKSLLCLQVFYLFLLFVQPQITLPPSGCVPVTSQIKHTTCIIQYDILKK